MRIGEVAGKELHQVIAELFEEFEHDSLKAQEEIVKQQEKRAAIDRANLKTKKANIGIAKLQKQKQEAAQTSAEHQP